MKGSYLNLSETEFENRVRVLRAKLEDCDVCALKCGVDRLDGETGKCNSGEKLEVSSASPHYGEERPLVGKNGSGTIFLSNCNLSCVYCQNYRISQMGRGRTLTTDEFAGLMLDLQEKGCHNINWVSPSHFVPQLVEAVKIASEKGLELPIVYNTGGYDNPETMKLLDGVVDIYMPDMKYSSSELGLMYSKVPSYKEINQKVVKEAHRQVGDLQLGASGLAQTGLLIRHLVLPENPSNTEGVLRFIADEVSEDSYVNIMDQYRTCWKASEYPELNRPLNWKEYRDALEFARSLGLHRGF